MTTIDSKVETPNLLYIQMMQILRDSFKASYDIQTRTLNEALLIDFIDAITQKLKAKELSKHHKVGLMELLEKLQDLYNAQSDQVNFDFIEINEPMTTQQLQNTPGWRLHKKFQSSLETKPLSSNSSQ